MVALRVGSWQIVLPVLGEYPSKSYSLIGITKEILRTTYSHILEYFVLSKRNPVTWKQITPRDFCLLSSQSNN